MIDLLYVYFAYGVIIACFICFFYKIEQYENKINNTDYITFKDFRNDESYSVINLDYEV